MLQYFPKKVNRRTFPKLIKNRNSPYIEHLILYVLQLPSRETWAGWRNGLPGSSWNSARTNVKSCFWYERSPRNYMSQDCTCNELQDQLCWGGPEEVLVTGKVGGSQQCYPAAKKAMSNQGCINMAKRSRGMIPLFISHEAVRFGTLHRWKILTGVCSAVSHQSGRAVELVWPGEVTNLREPNSSPPCWRKNWVISSPQCMADGWETRDISSVQRENIFPNEDN